MKYMKGIRILNEVLESLVEYEQVPSNTSDFIKRLLDDLHYDKRKISETTLNHFKEVFPHLFEKSADGLNKE